MASGRYDYAKIDALLAAKLDELGAERFSKMKVTEMERNLRASTTEPLPSRSQFRAAIHAFRQKRWPETAPRRRS